MRAITRGVCGVALAVGLVAGAQAPASKGGATEGGPPQGRLAGENWWPGVEGARPLTLKTPRGCWLYADWVVRAVPEGQAGDGFVVRDRRKLPRKATPEQLCAPEDTAVVFRQKAQLGVSFAGIAGRTLLLDKGTGVRGRVLTLQPLGERGAPLDVGYTGLAPVRVHKGVLYVFAPMVMPQGCTGTGFQPDVTEEACRERAHTLWRCVQQALAPRLDATPDPYEHPGAFSLATRTGGCQLELLEQQRLSLTERRPQPTGQVRGLGYFTAVE